MPLSRGLSGKDGDGGTAWYGRYDFVRMTVNRVSINELHSAWKQIRM